MPMRTRLMLSCSMLIVAALTFTTTLTAQATKTPTQAYMEYHAALMKAKSLDDLMPFVSAAAKKETASFPAEMKQGAPDMMREMTVQPGFKVTKEDIAGAKATLTVEGVNKAKAKTVITVSMVKEGTAWKLEKETQ